MTAKARLIPVVAVLLMALGNGGSSAGSARAGENCLAAPNAQPPQGSHWYYRMDPVKQSKCWYLRTEGRAIQTPATQEKPETAVTAKWPAGDDTVAWPDPPSPAGSDKVAWPNPPSPAGAGKVAWPNPPSPARGATQGATAESTHEQKASQTQEVPATAANSDKHTRNDARVDRQVAEPIEMEVSHSEIPVGILLAFAIGLVIAAIFVTFARRRTVYLDRREPVWTTSIGSDRTIPKFVAHHHDLASDRGENDRLDEVTEALRKLLRVLDRQAAV